VHRERATEASDRDCAPQRAGALPAAILALQRTAGNAATAALLQRTRTDAQTYAPAPGKAIDAGFRTNHIGTDEYAAVDKHADRGTHTTTNTYVAMTNEDAADEIALYLERLPASSGVASWDRFDFVTDQGYWCFETVLIDNATGVYEVRKCFATVSLQAWWVEGLGVFALGHMHGLGRPLSAVTTSRVDLSAMYS
jgi:hypothetical protein